MTIELAVRPVILTPREREFYEDARRLLAATRAVYPWTEGMVAGPTKISGLSAVAAGADAQLAAVDDAGVTKSISLLQLKAYMGDQLQNQSTADQAVAAATLTYLAGSSIAVPVGKLRIGTFFTWRLFGTKTAAGVTTGRAIHVRIGTNGTTADAAVLTFTSAGTPAATVDTGIWDITAIIRGPLSAACIASGALSLVRGTGGAAAGGLLASGVATENIQATSAGFDATVANLIVGLSITTAAAEAITFQGVFAEAKNL